MKINNVEHLNALQNTFTHITMNVYISAFPVLCHLIFKQLNEGDQVTTPTYK